MNSSNKIWKPGGLGQYLADLLPQGGTEGLQTSWDRGCNMETFSGMVHVSQLSHFHPVPFCEATGKTNRLICLAPQDITLACVDVLYVLYRLSWDIRRRWLFHLKRFAMRGFWASCLISWICSQLCLRFPGTLEATRGISQAPGKGINACPELSLLICSTLWQPNGAKQVSVTERAPFGSLVSHKAHICPWPGEWLGWIEADSSALRGQPLPDCCGCDDTARHRDLLRLSGPFVGCLHVMQPEKKAVAHWGVCEKYGREQRHEHLRFHERVIFRLDAPSGTAQYQLGLIHPFRLLIWVRDWICYMTQLFMSWQTRQFPNSLNYFQMP